MSVSLTPEEQAAAQEAAMAALRAFNIEAFTLLGVALLITGLRTHVRISSVGFKNLWADDYLVIVAAIAHGIETGLAYSVGNIAHGLANNSMTEAERRALHSNDVEYQLRVLGSKIQLAGWTTYSILLWTLKAAMCTFYYRLTKDLNGYRPKIFIGFGFIIASWVVVMLNLLLSCRPFNHMWQISPDPGLYCQPAISPALVWTYLSFNVATDIYLILIPMPMLWKAAMPVFQKFWLIALFSCGLFVTMAAILRVALLVSDPVNGAQLAGSWAVRETFVAVITTNVPMLFPHVKKWAGPLVTRVSTSLGLSKTSRSTRTTGSKLSKITLDTWRRRSGRSSRALSNPMASQARNESEQHIITDVVLQDLSQSNSANTVSSKPGIQRQVEVVVSEETSPPHSSPNGGNYTNTWSNSRPLPPLPQRETRSEFYLNHVHQRNYTKH